MELIKVSVSIPGTLSSNFIQIGDVVTYKTGNISFSDSKPVELIVEGPLDSGDVMFFRELCGGGDVLSKRFKRYVEILDLSRAMFVSCDSHYFTSKNDFYTAYHKTKSRTITSFMFAKLKLHKVILPSDITTIESNAFFGSFIPNIIFPDDVLLLQQESLCNCGIESISINAETILQKSFSMCTNLSEIKIGEKVKHINGAFSYNIKLRSVEVAKENKYLKIQNHCLLNSAGTQLILHAQKSECEKLIIPEGVERVCGGAIQGESTLSEIVLPNSLRYIGQRAFLRTNIKEMHIPAEVISISNNALPKSLNCLYFHSEFPPETKSDIYHRCTTIYVPRGCADSYKQKITKHANIIQESEYNAQARIPRKEVKNRAFYKKLVCEIKEMIPIEITHHTDVINQGRFDGEEFIYIWKKNLYYIKWMLRLGAITDITNNVFTHLLQSYPMKRPAINNLKALLTVCKVKRAQEAEEAAEYRKQLLNYLEEQRKYKEELDEIELANKLFEDMMNEYEAWGNID